MAAWVRWIGFAEKMQKIELRFIEEKMKNVSVFLVVSVLTLSVLQNAYGFSGQGSGTKQDPYIITNVNQLQEMNNDLDAWYELGNDIDASDTINWNSGEGFIPIGNETNHFTGNFDGQNYNITDLFIDRSSNDYQGLFGYVKNSIIENIGLINADVSGNSYVGGLTGYNSGTISNSYSAVTIDEVYYAVGGLVGWNDGTINNSYATGTVHGGGYIGGLVGVNFNGIISNSYSTGYISAYGYYVGGLVGCYQGTISNSYWDINTSGQTSSDGGEGKITAEMKQQATFTGWDFVNSWTIREGIDYPRLLRQVPSKNWVIEAPNGGEVLTGGSTYSVTWTSTGIGIVLIKYSSDNGLSWTPIDTVANTGSYNWLVPAVNSNRCLVRISDASNPSISDTSDRVFTVIFRYSGGSGTQADPYRISTVADWQQLMNTSADWNQHFILTADLNLAGVTLTPVGLRMRPFITDTPFTGVFDGNHNIISNAVMNEPGRGGGLFGYVDPGGQIRDLGVEDVTVNGSSRVGGLVGSNAGTLTDCYVTGAVSGTYGEIYGTDSIGGLVGLNYGTLTDCYATGSVTGNYGVGGLAGYNGGSLTGCYATGSVSGGYDVGGVVGTNIGTLTACYATGAVSGGAYRIGGLVGWNYGNCSSLTSCYASGSVSGSGYVGGLAGYNSNGCSLTDCYASGAVSGVGCGGLVGANDGGISNCYSTGAAGLYSGGLVWQNRGTLTACFWDIQTSGRTTSDGGTGKSTDEMQTKSTFTAAGWDFVTPVWTIHEGLDYPRLWWQISNVAPVADAGEDQNTPMLFELNLDGSASYDPDEDYPLTYSWQILEKPQGSAAELSDPDSVNPSLIPDVLGEYRIELVVTDSRGLESEPNYVVITAITIEDAATEKLAETIQQIGELDPDAFKNPNAANALINMIEAALKMVEKGNYKGALNKISNEILKKTDGCANTGQPDKNDWILTCEDQEKLYPLVARAIELLQRLLE